MSSSLAASRRALLALAVSAPLIRAARAQGQPREFRIGFQKSGPLLVAKQNRDFEKAFEPLGIAVTWVEFTYGPPLLEALNVGSIDFGAVGDAPPIFAQAARAKLLCGSTASPATSTRAFRCNSASAKKGSQMLQASTLPRAKAAPASAGGSSTGVMSPQASPAFSSAPTARLWAEEPRAKASFFPFSSVTDCSGLSCGTRMAWLAPRLGVAAT